MTRQFVHEISPRLTAMGLTVEVSEKASNANFDKALPADLAASPAVALAAAWVRGADTTPEFLPPKVQPWQQWMSKGLSTANSSGWARRRRRWWLRRHRLWRPAMATLTSLRGNGPNFRPKWPS
jgi:hypothetical protein